MTTQNVIQVVDKEDTQVDGTFLPNKVTVGEARAMDKHYLTEEAN